MQDHVDHIASLLYEGILSPSDWRAGLDAIRNCMQGGLFYHFAVDKSSLAIVSSHQNVEVPADKVRDYELHHARDDERMPIVMGLAVGEMMFDHEHFSARELSNSFIYSDWLPSIGYRHTMSLPLHDDGTTREFLSIIRPSDHHAYNTDDRRFMEHLLPHLSRAARLRSQSTHLACQAALGTAALDALPQCVALLDTHHRIRYLNNAARLALDNSPYLAVRHGQLYCTDPQAQERLCASVAAACRLDDTARAGILQCAPDTTIHVLPLKASHPLAVLQLAQPHSLLVWAHHNPWQHTEPLRVALGLTDTEARLALALATGKSLKDFAVTQECSWHTARTHARNLLRKTGCHRQAELVHLVQSLIQH